MKVDTIFNLILITFVGICGVASALHGETGEAILYLVILILLGNIHLDEIQIVKLKRTIEFRRMGG